VHEGEETSMKFAETIFVIEEIDACEVTHDRKKKADAEADADEPTGSGAAKVEQPAEAPQTEEERRRMRRRMERHGIPASSSAAASRHTGDDELNLGGILEVLDGVVDTPGRMLIMTTNHLSVLDPALTRPGRINKKILLGYMTAFSCMDMLRNYYDEPGNAARLAAGGELEGKVARIFSLMAQRKITEAAEAETPEERMERERGKRCLMGGFRLHASRGRAGDAGGGQLGRAAGRLLLQLQQQRHQRRQQRQRKRAGRRRRWRRRRRARRGGEVHVSAPHGAEPTGGSPVRRPQRGGQDRGRG
jgi:hypothetical protein